MNVSLLKFPNKSEWLVVPNGYNTSQLIEIYEKEDGLSLGSLCNLT